MRVVVTGASGNIGSATIRELTAGGRHEVVGVARRRPELSDRAVAEGSVTWRPADVATDDLDPILEGADAVVHLAWKFQPTHQPQRTWQTNVVGTRRLLAAVRRRQVPALVCSSSLAAYSPADHDDLVDEGWETDGTSSAAYCREKAYNERVLDAFEATGETRVVRMRPAFVFQRSAASEQRRIFGGALLRPWMLERRMIPAVPVPRGLRLQALHAEDAARGFVAAVERPVSGAFNLAAAGVLRREELGEIVGAPTVEVPARLVSGALDLGWLTHLLPVPGSLADAMLSVPLLATDRARAELDWEPRHTAAEAVEAFLSGAAQSAGSGMPPLHP